MLKVFLHFGSKLFLLVVIIRPNMLNSCFDAALLEGGHRYLMVTLLMAGN